MSEKFWDTSFNHPLTPREGRPLRTLRDADDFVRNRCASLQNPGTSATLNALKAAAVSGDHMDAQKAFSRASRLMHENRWG